MYRSTLVALTVAVMAAACEARPGPATSDPTRGVTTTAEPTLQPAMTFPAAIADVADGELTPGTYFIDPDLDPNTTLLVDYTIPAAGWQKWYGAYKANDGAYVDGPEVGISIIMVRTLLVHGCTDHSARTPTVGPSVGDLAAALTKFPPFEAVGEPRDVELAGYPGQYVELEVPDLHSVSANPFGMCEGGKLRGWIAWGQVMPFYGYSPGQREGFYILDVEGARLVIAASWAKDATPTALAELQQVIDSIVVRP